MPTTFSYRQQFAWGQPTGWVVTDPNFSPVCRTDSEADAAYIAAALSQLTNDQLLEAARKAAVANQGNAA
jgi:hypothetical protein